MTPYLDWCPRRWHARTAAIRTPLALVYLDWTYNLRDAARARYDWEAVAHWGEAIADIAAAWLGIVRPAPLVLRLAK